MIARLHQDQVFWGPLWARLGQRRALLTLQELSALDWPDPPRELYIEREFNPQPVVGTLPPKPDYGLGFIQRYFRRGEFGEDPAAPRRQHDLEVPLITLALCSFRWHAPRSTGRAVISMRPWSTCARC